MIFPQHHCLDLNTNTLAKVCQIWGPFYMAQGPPPHVKKSSQVSQVVPAATHCCPAERQV